MNPLYPALERLPFSGFQSSPIADRRGSAIRPATHNPEKRQTASAAGRGRQPFTEGDISLNSLTEAPVVFLAFAMGETASPERSVRRMQRGQDIPHVKRLKKTRG
ncbi:MAG: hypothetical protein JRI35_02770 [Deltaproteobacteria bacterium]|nr:hypothetical protein [Deltaproteobacteria bacterium]